MYEWDAATYDRITDPQERWAASRDRRLARSLRVVRRR
jgi:hypothetical protein